MTQPTNAFSSYDAVGAREDLTDIIYNIDPTETPFMMMARRGRAEAVLHEWQMDQLAAVDENNAQVEGDDYEGEAVTPTDRLNNRTQISSKTVVITGTQETIRKAGRKSEMAYQLAKRFKELKRDMEAILTRNGPIAVGNDSTARTLGGLETWLSTNADRGAGGAAAARTNNQPDAGAQPTDGTQRALTEDAVKSVIQSAWTNGGNPGVIMCGPVNKQNVSAFTGHSTRQDRGEDQRLVAAISMYVSDFGEHRIVPNRFQRDRTLFVLDPALWAVSYLRSFRQRELAITGDSDKRLVLVEYSLEAKNERGSGVVADLTTS